MDGFLRLFCITWNTVIGMRGDIGVRFIHGEVIRHHSVDGRSENHKYINTNTNQLQSNFRSLVSLSLPSFQLQTRSRSLTPFQLQSSFIFFHSSSTLGLGFFLHFSSSPAFGISPHHLQFNYYSPTSNQCNTACQPTSAVLSLSTGVDLSHLDRSMSSADIVTSSLVPWIGCAVFPITPSCCWCRDCEVAGQSGRRVSSYEWVGW